MRRIITGLLIALVALGMLSATTVNAEAASRSQTVSYGMKAHKKTNTGVILHCYKDGRIFGPALVLQKGQKGVIKCRFNPKYDAPYGVTAWVPTKNKIRVYRAGIKYLDTKPRRGKEVLIIRSVHTLKYPRTVVRIG